MAGWFSAHGMSVCGHLTTGQISVCMNLGIAASILECVQAEALRHPDGRITKVGVKIGELSWR